MKQKVDILICGAGPVGLSLAVECARHGVDFLLIEQDKERSPYSKALGIWSNTLEAFEAMGVISEVLEQGLHIKQAQFFIEGKPTKPLPFGESVRSKYPTPIILPQYNTETILEQRLKALGGELLRGVKLLSFVEETDSIKAVLTSADERHTVEARFLAACDGARSTIREQLAIPFSGYTEPEIFALCDATLKGPLPEKSLIINWGKSAPVALFPISEQIWRVVTTLKTRTLQDKPLLSDIQAALDTQGPYGLTLTDPVWLSYFNVNERVCHRFVHGRVFLLGDAAHIHSPAGGQGMNTGIQDAYNLGWKLKYLIKRPATSALISESYDAERHPTALKIIKEAAARQHIATSHNPFARLLKKTLFTLIPHIPFMRRKITYALCGLDIRYQNSPLLENGNTALIGTKLRDFTVSSKTELPSTHAIAATGCHLLLINDPHTSLPSLPSEIVVCTIMHASSPLKKGEWLLARPDLYIASTGHIGNWAPLENYLQKLYTQTT